VHQQYATARIDKARLRRALLVVTFHNTTLPLNGSLMDGFENLND
jgi:hypothetical protein